MRPNVVPKLILSCSLGLPMYLSANPLTVPAPGFTAASPSAASSANGDNYPIPDADPEFVSGASIAENFDLSVKAATELNTITAVAPEPATSLLLGLGLLGVTFIGRRLRKRG